MQKLKKRGGGREETKFLWIFDVVKKFFLRAKFNFIYISNIRIVTSFKNWKKNIRWIFNEIEIKISLAQDVKKLYLHYFFHESKISSRKKKKKKKNISQEFIQSNWKSIFQEWKKILSFILMSRIHDKFITHERR